MSEQPTPPQVTPPIIAPNLEYDEILNQSTPDKSNYSPQSNGVASEETLNQVIDDLITECKIKEISGRRNRIKLSIAILAQQGATSPRFSETKVANQIQGISISVASLRKIAKKNSTTVRALARALRPEAIKVAEKFSIEGNLSKSYKLEHPDAQQSDLYWVSDFQSFSNDPSMPPNVKTWLLSNYANRFAPKKSN